MSVRYIVGDVMEVLRSMPDASVDLVLSSPPRDPFLALRSYLPADHPDKAKEIGSEPTPGAFIDTLLDVVEECRRVLAPHGSLCFELGDTYAGSGGAGGDYNANGLREGQARFDGSARRGSGRVQYDGMPSIPGRKHYTVDRAGDGWPLEKSLCLVPELLRIAMVYGVNPLTGRTTQRWRARNVVRWCLDGDTVVYAKTPKGVGPARLLHLAQNWQPGQWQLWDGSRWAHVLGWSATSADDAIEIEFRNGERISATREHQWPTERGLRRTDELTVGDRVPHVRLPDTETVSPAMLADDDIGWLVGTFLADGSFDSRDRIQIAGHRDESELRRLRMARIAAAYDGTCTAHAVGDGNEGVVVIRSYVLAAIIRRYVAGDSARNKSLQPAVWRRSNAFLHHLLAGYLEGDGWYDAKNDRWRLNFTDNQWLARDLRTVCARLAYSCRIRRAVKPADARGGQFLGTASHCHRGDIRMQPGPMVKAPGEVVALRPSKRRRFYDIGVEGEPHLFALASGILTHNCRPNPPVGALGDKVRPATSDILVACVDRKRYFDLDAVRLPGSANTHARTAKGVESRPSTGKSADDDRRGGNFSSLDTIHETNGAPPLDHWWFDEVEDLFPQDAWHVSTEPYKGSHYATWPSELLKRPILAMCPARVCTTCGEPSSRVLGPATYVNAKSGDQVEKAKWMAGELQRQGAIGRDNGALRVAETTGWSDCGHGTWRQGVVLDPFAGSGTTLLVAHGHGRSAIGVDLDERNADLARERVGMWLEVEHHRTTEEEASA
jgi:hypothetical protein